MQLKELVAEWQEKSRNDILSARFLVNMLPMPAEVIGFHAQQAVEKAFKAVLVMYSINPQKSHDLLYLHKMCLSHTDIQLDCESACARLNPYAVEHRYPGEVSVASSQVLEDLHDAESICARIMEYLNTKLASLQ